MNSLRVSSRLYIIVGVSIIVMLILFAVNWLSLGHLAQLQNDGVHTLRNAGQLKHDANLGAQAYRVVADTYINQNFDDVKKKWDQIHKEIDTSFALAGKIVNTPQQSQQLETAKRAIETIRKIYDQQFLPMVKLQAPHEEVGPVDDAIDKQIDLFDSSFSALAESLDQDAKRLDQDYDATVSNLRMIMALTIITSAIILIVLTTLVARSIIGQLGLELHEATELAHAIAEGDLTHDFSNDDKRPDSLASALNDMLTALKKIVSSVRNGSESVASASAEIAQGNQDLSARTESQASSLEETSASMDELNSQVKHNASNAHLANQLAINASTVAVSGGDVVGRVVETMREINDSSRKISDIIGVIDGIAFQTNILALNAAVEAARAGEQGRGFAVVASEVRSLAGRSAEAAKEIKNLINASVDRVQHGSQLVDEAGSTMAEVVSAIQKVCDLVQEISLASNEQAQSVMQVSSAVTQIDDVTQQNAALVEQIAAAAMSLRNQSDDLVQSVASFRLGNN
ncbi:methyl-accepting chemotaxis protein [Undibacterium fentianense]|uniref:Methyl-accepting chemotaxis protein n=1 Tax=Undibacterium fentianense TaxID=2828728 RepID=A0A941ICR4_9BURK|nr:methyl-accepting chemotaxis protein [Undibacterium fentianense]MBR7800479.1 hypothetical protein [Undibacterium fentianense]